MKLPLLFLLCASLGSGLVNASSSMPPASGGPAALTAGPGNPFIPGYYADPSLVEHEGLYFLYATQDPWGGDSLGCWSSSDFKDWRYERLDWPTKRACTSPTSKPNKVWAPSVIRAPGGGFVMYVSVGSEIWVGKADHPLGPWRNALGDRPLIPSNFRPGYHMIDAEAFVDDDGRVYLYWGSGWDWKNGRCWAVRLNPDLVSFAETPRDVTPAHYFEAPFMVKHASRYYLMYSQGKTLDDSYEVRYAVGASPFGPFTEASNSPVLATDLGRNVRGPGHHAVWRHDGRVYVLYHRHGIPFDPDFVARQLCVDEMRFDPDGLIEKIVPTRAGPDLPRKPVTRENLDFADPALGATARSSDDKSPATGAACVLDRDFATRWAAAPGSSRPWLLLDLGAERTISRQEIRFEYAWKSYRFRCEASLDGESWTVLADREKGAPASCPLQIERGATVRYLRLIFTGTEPSPSVFEWSVR